VRLKHFDGGSLRLAALSLLFDHGIAKFDAFIANADAVRPGNQVAGGFFRFSAKGADRFTGLFVIHRNFVSLFVIRYGSFAGRKSQ
jgi:hypothetical protein